MVKIEFAMIRSIMKHVTIHLFLANLIFASSDSLAVREYVGGANPYYNYRSISFSPQSSAIVLIDLWDREVVTPLLERKLLSFIEIARKEGVTIIHAPSQRYDEMHPLISVYPEDILITGYDDMGTILHSKGISTLLYAGNDVVKCVLDKPLGAIHHHLDNGEFKYVLIKDGTTSAYAETQLLGINIFEKAFGNTTTIIDILDALEHYERFESSKELVLPTYIAEASKKQKDVLYSEEMALVVIQPQEYSSKIGNGLSDVLLWADSVGVRVVYQNDISELNNYSNYYNITSEKQFTKFIRMNDIQNVVYIGSSIDEDMLWGELGLLRLYMQGRYRRNPMPNCFVVSDYSEFSNLPLALTPDTAKELLLNEYRGINRISFADIKRICKKGKRDYDLKNSRLSKILLRVFPPHQIELSKAYDSGQIRSVIRELYIWFYVYKWFLATFAIVFLGIGYLGSHYLGKNI